MKLNCIKSLIKDESGATAIEYGLIAAVMLTIVIGAYTVLEDDLKTAFTSIGTTLKTPKLN